MNTLLKQYSVTVIPHSFADGRRFDEFTTTVIAANRRAAMVTARQKYPADLRGCVIEYRVQRATARKDA